MSRTVEILPDLPAIAQRATEIFLSQMNKAIQRSGKFSVALAGGSTPKALYRLLVAHPLPLEKIHLFWGDERYVPPSHPDSNQRMVQDAWLSQIDFPAENLHAMPTGSNNPLQDAKLYEQELQHYFQVAKGQFPSFDLILLGMGDDGHTASLFPYTPALDVCDALVTPGIKDDQPRLTLTIPVLNQAQCVVFMVAGASKAQALQRVFAPDADPKQYPSRFIQPIHECYWLLDSALEEVTRP